MNLILATCRQDRRADVVTVVGIFSSEVSASEALAADIANITNDRPTPAECIGGWTADGYRWAVTPLTLDRSSCAEVS